MPHEPSRSGEDGSTHGDGVLAVTVGTAVWAIATVVTFLLRNRLRADGALWWMWTCVTGFVLGLLGLWWVRRRRARLARTDSAAAGRR